MGRKMFVKCIGIFQFKKKKKTTPNAIAKYTKDTIRIKMRNKENTLIRFNKTSRCGTFKFRLRNKSRYSFIES